MEIIVVSIIVLAAVIYLMLQGLSVLKGIRERRNTSCESCGVSSCCSSAKKPDNQSQKPA